MSPHIEAHRGPADVGFALENLEDLYAKSPTLTSLERRLLHRCWDAEKQLKLWRANAEECLDTLEAFRMHSYCQHDDCERPEPDHVAVEKEGQDG